MCIRDRSVTNYTRRHHRRIRWLIGLEYRTSIDQLKSIREEINNLIEKAKTNAVKPLADKVLGFISMIESIIFPLPVDPFLAGLTLAAPRKAFRFAIICTIGSVIGGVIGWLLGYLIGPSIENLFLYFPWFTEEKFNVVKFAYQENGMLIIFLGNCFSDSSNC